MHSFMLFGPMHGAKNIQQTKVFESLVEKAMEKTPLKPEQNIVCDTIGM